jgi:tripartite-type tricarboxylate transporter receptor subunit TctC
MEYVAHREGIKWVHVPYTGSVQVITAVLGGHIEAGSVGPEWVSYVHAGTLRILATHEEVCRLPEHSYFQRTGL